MIKGTADPETGAFKVFVDGHLFDPAASQRLVNHSPDGFAWGYSGSGPAQLALALLLHFTRDTAYVMEHYQDFKRDVIAGLDQAGFAISSGVVTRWIKANR